MVCRRSSTESKTWASRHSVRRSCAEYLYACMSPAKGLTQRCARSAQCACVSSERLALFSTTLSSEGRLERLEAILELPVGIHVTRWQQDPEEVLQAGVPEPDESTTHHQQNDEGHNKALHAQRTFAECCEPDRTTMDPRGILARARHIPRVPVSRAWAESKNVVKT